MKKTFKKILALALALCLVFPAISTGIVAMAAENDAPILELDSTAMAVISKSGDYAIFHFIPAESGYYSFYSSSASDTYGYIYNMDGSELARDDDGGERNNFRVGCYMVGGETYELRARFYSSSDTGSFPVAVRTARGVSSVSFPGASVMEGTHQTTSSYDYESGTDIYWNRYNYSQDIVVTYSDGSQETLRVSGSFYLNTDLGQFYFSMTDDQSFGNEWEVGEHSVSVVCEALNIRETFTVTVTPNPVASITATPISLMENQGGSDYGSYYHYYLDGNDTAVTVTLTDGTVLRNTGSGYNYQYIEYGGYDYSISVSIDQSAENPLLPGNTYEATVSVLGATCTVPVTIMEAPKPVSISATPITLMEGLNCSDYGDYYYYYIYGSNTVVTATMEDGTVLTNVDQWGNKRSYVSYDGYDFNISLSIEQSASRPLLPGNTYDATVSFLGATCTVPVTILEAPKAVSVTAEPFKFIEGMGGYNLGDYYQYNVFASATTVEVTLNDGTVLRNAGNSSIYYNGYSFPINLSIEQSASRPLLPGNTYAATLSVLGATCTVPVTIIATPATSIEVLEVEPVYTIDYYYIQNGNYIYNIPDFNVKVTFENGDEVIMNRPTWSTSTFSCSDNQSQTPWTVGGENLVTVSFMGVSTQFSVELIEKNFKYTVQDGVAYITGCFPTSESLVIPSEIDGYTVKGVTSFYPARKTIKELTIPDSVTYISESALSGDKLETLNLGAGIEEIGIWHSCDLRNLKEINISTSNQNYASIDGVLYNKTIDTLILYPVAKGNTYDVPPTVTDFSVLNYDLYAGLNINLDPNSDAYVTVDGVTYTKDMTTVILCNPEKTGEYVMPETVTKITAYAFANSKLKKITVSSNVTEIVYCAFSNTPNLETVVLPDNLKKIDLQAFADSAVSNVNLPSSLEEIGEQAFRGTNLTKVEIPSSVKKISDEAFAEIDSLSEIIIHDGVETIGYSAFYRSGSASTPLQVRLPDSVTKLGSYAFATEALEKITLSSNLSEIPSCCFEGTGLTEITLPASVQKIDSRAFYNCLKLKTVNIEGNNVEINSSVFENAPIENFDFEKVSGAVAHDSFKGSHLTSIVFPETVTEISYRAFQASKFLEEVDFPEAIITLDVEVFNGTPWYENVYEKLEDGWVIYDNIFLGYKGNFPEEAPVLPEGVTSIVSDSMQYATFSSIELPNSLKTIGIGAFQYNENLTSIYIPENVSYIADTAFYACSSLSDIQVAENNQYYTAKDGALYNKDMTRLIFCGKQESGIFRVPSTVKEIAGAAFYTSGAKYIIFENSDVNIYGSFYPSLTVGYEIEGVEIETLPTLICDKSADSKVYAYAEENLYLTIDINTFSPNSIELEGSPKTTFEIGEELNLDELKVKVNYGEVVEFVDLTPEMVSGFDSSVAGVHKVTVSYLGFETSFDVTVRGEATVPSKTVYPGREFDIIVRLDTPMDCTSFSINNITYDNSTVELLSAEWLVEGLLIRDWDSAVNNGVATFAEATNLKGDLLKLTFKVKDDAEETTFDINCNVAVRLDSIDIPITVKAGTITIAKVLPGDVDGSGEVTDRDAVYLLYHTFLADRYPVNQDCDFNGDGEVTDKDAIYLLYHTFLPESYPLH